MTAEVRVGRWQDVLPGTYDPTRAIVITDPPYGLDAASSGTRGPGSHRGKRESAGDRGYLDEISWAQHVRDVLALPAKRHVIRGPATAIVRRDYPLPRRLCVEIAAYRRRSGHRPGVVPYLWQGWVVYGRLQLERHPEPPRGDACLIDPYGGRDMGSRGGHNHGHSGGVHRGVTPWQAASWAVETWSDPGCVIIDPFAGIGTIGAMASAFSLDYIGAELNPEWARVAQSAVGIARPSLGLVG